MIHFALILVYTAPSSQFDLLRCTRCLYSGSVFQKNVPQAHLTIGPRGGWLSETRARCMETQKKNSVKVRNPTMRKAFAGGVSEAATLLHGRVVHTPVLESRLLNQLIGGGRLLLKAECLQHTGSFKYRGALHRLLRLQQDDQLAASRGVIAFSSGNFGQALAAAATTLGIKCTIVSPHDAPSVKLERIRHYGATLRTSVADYTTGENREVVAAALAMRLSQEHGLHCSIYPGTFPVTNQVRRILYL